MHSWLQRMQPWRGRGPRANAHPCASRASRRRHGGVAQCIGLAVFWWAAFLGSSPPLGSSAPSPSPCHWQQCRLQEARSPPVRQGCSSASRTCSPTLNDLHTFDSSPAPSPPLGSATPPRPAPGTPHPRGGRVQGERARRQASAARQEGSACLGLRGGGEHGSVKTAADALAEAGAPRVHDDEEDDIAADAPPSSEDVSAARGAGGGEPGHDGSDGFEEVDAAERGAWGREERNHEDPRKESERILDEMVHVCLSVCLSVCRSLILSLSLCDIDR